MAKETKRPKRSRLIEELGPRATMQETCEMTGLDESGVELAFQPGSAATTEPKQRDEADETTGLARVQEAMMHSILNAFSTPTSPAMKQAKPAKRRRPTKK